MVVLENVVTHLENPDFAPALTEGLRTWPDVQAADIDRVVKWVLSLRSDLVSLVKTVGDPDEVTMTLAINYIELKSRWIALNTKINYENFRKGSCDSVTALRATAISTLLAKVEELLTPDDIDQITQFLAVPIRRAA